MNYTEDNKKGKFVFRNCDTAQEGKFGFWVDNVEWLSIELSKADIWNGNLLLTQRKPYSWQFIKRYFKRPLTPENPSGD